MVCDMNMPVFSAHSEWLARVEIEVVPATAFAMRDAGVVHDLGFADATAYTLLEAPSTDDAWTVGVRPTARWIEIADAATDGPLSRWLPDEHRAAGLALAAHLPQGSYWWVRSRIEPYPTDTILLGNEYVDRTPDIIELMQRPDCYAAIVSQVSGGAPILDQPLLGVPILNYDGSDLRCGVLFFPCIQGDRSPRHERLLVVPETGMLVLDAQRRFSEADHHRSLQRWASTGAHRFAELLAT
jgi:hypothetical protein